MQIEFRFKILRVRVIEKEYLALAFTLRVIS